MRRGSAAGKKSQEKQKIDPRRIKVSEQDHADSTLQIVKNIFKDRSHITDKDIQDLKDSFEVELMRYEFFTFKPDEAGKISLESFLMSIISCMHGAKTERYIKRISKVA